MQFIKFNIVKYYFNDNMLLLISNKVFMKTIINVIMKNCNLHSKINNFNASNFFEVTFLINGEIG